MDACRVDFDSTSWESPMNGVRSKARSRNGRRLRVVEFSQEFVEPDWCRKGHIGYVLDGEMEIDFDGEVVRFGKGDGVFIVAGDKEKHVARVLSEVVTLVLVEDE